MRRRWPSTLVVAAALVLAGCSSPGIDPALTTSVASALSSGASAQIGLKLALKDRILPGTITALLGDMANALAGTERELEMQQAADARDAAYRSRALKGVRASLEAVHVAQGGHAAVGLNKLTAAMEDLSALEQSG